MSPLAVWNQLIYITFYLNIDSHFPSANMEHIRPVDCCLIQKVHIVAMGDFSTQKKLAVTMHGIDAK